MAIVKIQHRRGNYADYDPSKVLPGELVVTQADDPNSSDGEAVYIATTAGNVKRLAVAEELDSAIETALQDAIPEVVSEATQEAEAAADRAEAAAEHLVTDTTLTIAGRAADAKKTGDEIANLKSDFEQLQSDVFQPSGATHQKKINELLMDGTFTNGVAYPPSDYPPENPGTMIGVGPNNPYNVYYGVISQNMDIYFDENLNVGTFVIGVISNVTNITTNEYGALIFTGSNPLRYRYTQGSYPSLDNKLHVKANDTVIACIGNTVSTDDVLVYYETEGDTVDKTLLNNNIRLNDAQIEQMGGVNNSVRYDIAQSKSDVEKIRAKNNIGLSHLDEIAFTYGYFIKTGPVNIGETIDLTPMAYFNQKFAISECKEGDAFLLNIKGGGLGRAWCFADKDNLKISSAEASTTLTNEIIIAPENAAKIIINDIYRESEQDTTSTGGTAYKIVDDTGKNVKIVTDTTLTKTGVPADAKSVGDTFASIGVTAIEPLKTDIPSLFITGTLPTSKDDGNVKVRVDYKSQTTEFTEYATLKVQGNSSTAYPKKNFTIKFFSDSECTVKSKHNFMGWGNQNKYVLKANWSDVTQSRNVVTARLWTDVLRSRSDFMTLPSALRTAPNYAVINGFIIKVFANGIYQGRYTFNLPKDPYMFNMDDSVDTNCVLYSENYDSGCFKSAAVVDGTDWTDEIHEDNPPQSVIARLNAFITFLNNSSDASFVSDLHNYVDVQSIVDYYLFGLVDAGFDSFGKNQILLSYDNCPYIASVYDLDCTWGIRYDGAYLYPTDHPFSSYYGIADGNVLYLRFPNLFASNIKTRYEELRNGALSAANIIYRFEDFLRMQTKELVEEDYASTTANGAFVDMPSKNLTSLTQIRNYAAARLDYVDSIILT